MKERGPFRFGHYRTNSTCVCLPFLAAPLSAQSRDSVRGIWLHTGRRGVRPQPDVSGFISSPGTGEAVFPQLLQRRPELPLTQGENFVNAPVSLTAVCGGRQHYFHCPDKGTETREVKEFARSHTVSGRVRIQTQVCTQCIVAFLPSLMRHDTETNGRESDQDLYFTLPL